MDFSRSCGLIDKQEKHESDAQDTTENYTVKN